MKPWHENLIIIALILVATALLPGCTSMLIGNALNQGKDLTPEQIEAYNKVGSRVFSCLTVKGPPPAGATVIITVPKDGTTFAPKFGDNCQVIQ